LQIPDRNQLGGALKRKPPLMVRTPVVHPWGYNKKIAMPSPEALSKAFAELGTQKEVAMFFNVSKATVLKWEIQLGMNVESHREIPRAKVVVGLLSDAQDRVRIAQWICDEGTISTSYDLKGDNTYLAVGGSMVDGYVLEEIGKIVNGRVNNLTKSPRLGWMPMRYVRLHSAEAYALLAGIRNELGLKRFESEAALYFFPPCGYVHGRHSTDEFMLEAWHKYAEGVVSSWNRMSKVPLLPEEVNKIIGSWIESRVKRARYFRDRAQLESQMK